MSYFYSVAGELDNATYMNTHYAAFKQALQNAVDNSVEMAGFIAMMRVSPPFG